MKIIGITGPSGAGKTTLCGIIEKNYNAKIIDADKIAKRLSNDKESEYYKKMVDLFEDVAMMEDGSLDRKRIASIIYFDDDKRNKLNKLTFKYVVEEMKKEILDAKYVDIVIIDAPLLYEAKMHKICDFVVAVLASENNKLERICQRDGIDEEFARKRLDIQNKDEFFIRNADYIIYNDMDVEHLEKSFKNILEEV